MGMIDRRRVEIELAANREAWWVRLACVAGPRLDELTVEVLRRKEMFATNWEQSGRGGHDPETAAIESVYEDVTRWGL